MNRLTVIQDTENSDFYHVYFFGVLSARIKRIELGYALLVYTPMCTYSIGHIKLSIFAAVRDLLIFHLSFCYQMRRLP